jgi:hypothetical protein
MLALRLFAVTASSARPFFMPVFTNDLEGVFSEAHLITFNTNITHLGDTLAALKEYPDPVTWQRRRHVRAQDSYRPSF